jgi:cytochrome c biogenesis protein CcdA
MKEFLLGLAVGGVYSFSPCIVPLLPIYIANILPSPNAKRKTVLSIYYIAIFALGVTASFSILSTLMQFTKLVLLRYMASIMKLIYLFMVIMGLYQLIELNFKKNYIGGIKNLLYERFRLSSRWYFSLIAVFLKSNIRIFIGFAFGVLAMSCNYPLYSLFFYKLSSENWSLLRYFATLLGFFLGMYITAIVQYILFAFLQINLFKRFGGITMLLFGLFLIFFGLYGFYKSFIQ